MNIVRTPWILTFFCFALVAVAQPGCGGQKSSVKKTDTADEDHGDDRSGPRRAGTPDLDEDEDDDGSRIEGLKGRLEVYDIQRGFEPHTEDISACFTSRVGKRRFIGGEVEFQFVVAPDGTVKTVHFLRSDLGAWDMESCMLEIARAMTFAKPKGNADADFTIPLRFDARQAVNIWNEVRGAEEVDDKKAAELAACAEESGTEDPANVWVTIYIGTRGKVMSAGFASPNGPLADEWATCAKDKIMAWKLTDPRGRAKLSYNYNP